MKKEITHSFHFSCKPTSIISALTEEKHIQNWWTRGVFIESGKGIFQWESYGWTVELILEKAQDDQAVVWKCIKSNMQNTPAWEGTEMHFKLTLTESGTYLNFRHSGYTDSPCYDVCVEGWSFVLGKSLKSYLETGKGMPYSVN